MLKHTLFALGMRKDLCPRMAYFELDELSLGEHLVNDANARPQNQLATGLFDEVTAQILIRRKNNGLVHGDLAEDLYCIARGADDITHRLDLCAAIDIAHDDVVRVLLSETLEKMRWAALRQRAPGFQVRDQDLLRWVENLRRLSHK